MQGWRAEDQGRRKDGFPYRRPDVCKDPWEGSWGGGCLARQLEHEPLPAPDRRIERSKRQVLVPKGLPEPAGRQGRNT